MIAVIQRITEAKVVVAGATVGHMGPGLLALVSIHADDTPSDITWMANKMTTLRIFRNADKHFDVDVKQINGGILLVSNFTVAGQTRRGRRPSFDQAAPPDLGRQLFDHLITAVSALGIPTSTGQFGADMQVILTNDGPATFILDSTEARAE